MSADASKPPEWEKVLRPVTARSLYLLLIVLTAVTASWWSTSGFLRKNDQAAILAGAHDWATGQRQAWRQYYQFDKTYVLYAYTAAALRLRAALRPSADPVRWANRAVAAAFWLALSLFTIRYRHALHPVLLAAGLTAPAILLNTQYVNSSTLSSALLLLSLTAWPRRTPAAILLFLAVGARADVVLLVPLYCWLVLPFPWSGKEVLEFFHRLEKTVRIFPVTGKKQHKSSIEWKTPSPKVPLNGKNGPPFSMDWKTPFFLIGAAAIALLAGQWWAGGAGTALDPFFNLKMVAGYIVFGFGAAGLVFGWMCGRLIVYRAVPLVWRLVGCAAFLLPVLFFLPQLHAPRYFWRGCEAVWMLAALRPDIVGHLRAGWRRTVWAVALIPLLIGVQWPSRSTLRGTWRSPTVFPSGDGHYPMGAYGSFLHRFRMAETVPVDHNQRVWWAARAARFEPDAHGAFPVLASPMAGYLQLSGSLQGWRAVRGDYATLRDTVFYLDSRTVARADVKFQASGLSAVLDGPLEPVSPAFDGIAILRVGRGDGEWGRRARLLNRLFGGDEYRTGAVDVEVPDGHRAVWFSDAPFAGAQRDDGSGLYYRLDAPAPDAQHTAWSALPAWMSMRNFSGSPY